MAFDLSSVLGQAKEVADQQQSGSNGGRGGYRLVYPGTGTLKVKLLYNPKSNLVARQVKRHKVENTNYICLSMYGHDCPICKTVDSIKNATGADLWKYNAKVRGISYAQYVGSDRYTWDSSNKEPQVGEIILLMYPWTVYQDINRIISSAGTQADKLIACNEGKVVNIMRWRENSQEKYKCEVDPFAADFKSAATEEEFEAMLNNLPDLNEAVAPATANQDTFKYANDAAETLSREYLRNSQYGAMPVSSPASSNQVGSNPSIIDDGNGNKYVLINGQYVPIAASPAQQSTAPAMNTPQSTPQYVPQTPISTPIQNQGNADTPPWNTQQSTPAVNNPAPVTGNGQSYPECFGSHQDNNSKCMACLYEIQCMTMQK